MLVVTTCICYFKCSFILGTNVLHDEDGFDGVYSVVDDLDQEDARARHIGGATGPADGGRQGRHKPRDPIVHAVLRLHGVKTLRQRHEPVQQKTAELPNP